MLETKSRIIGNYKYNVTELPCEQALELMVRVVKMFGPSLAELLNSPGILDQKAPMVQRLSSLDGVTLAKGLSEFCTKLSIEDLSYLRLTLGAASTMEGPGLEGPVELDRERQMLHFTGGKMMQLFRWLGFGLEVQLADFLESFATLQKQSVAEKGTSPSNSPTGLTGVSGE